MVNPLTTLPVEEETRPWYKRMTLVSGIILAAVVYAEAQGVVPAGLSSQLETMGEQAMALVQTLMGLGILTGLYRQAAK